MLIYCISRIIYTFTINMYYLNSRKENVKVSTKVSSFFLIWCKRLHHIPEFLMELFRSHCLSLDVIFGDESWLLYVHGAHFECFCILAWVDIRYITSQLGLQKIVGRLHSPKYQPNFTQTSPCTNHWKETVFIVPNIKQLHPKLCWYQNPKRNLEKHEFV